MVVPAIDDGHSHRPAGEAPGRCDPAEPSADDENMGFAHPLEYGRRSRLRQEVWAA